MKHYTIPVPEGNIVFLPESVLLLFSQYCDVVGAPGAVHIEDGPSRGRARTLPHLTWGSVMGYVSSHLILGQSY